MARDDDPSWLRQLLVSGVVLVAVALVVGGVLGLVALGAARVAGIGEPGAGSTARPSLYIPTQKPATEPLRPSSPAHPRATSKPGGTGKTQQPKPKRKPPAVTLHASPSKVAPGERINLTGSYPGGDGARLQVQRLEGGWSDFPVDVSVHGRRFATYVITSHTGENRFRVVDPATGRHSEPVRVIVG